MVATDDNGQPSYAFHGEGAADRWLALADLPAELPPDVEALTFGSYTMAVEPVGSALAALAERECGRRVISVDPNLRSAVVGDTARWAVAAERFYRTATIIKASDEDVRAARGGRVSIAEAAYHGLDCGARLVVVTEGAKGVTAFCATGHVSVQAHSVTVRDTVGAGDTRRPAGPACFACISTVIPAVGDSFSCATKSWIQSSTKSGGPAFFEQSSTHNIAMRQEFPVASKNCLMGAQQYRLPLEIAAQCVARPLLCSWLLQQDGRLSCRSHPLRHIPPLLRPIRRKKLRLQRALKSCIVPTCPRAPTSRPPGRSVSPIRCSSPTKTSP
jgi:hypothetical protein